MLNVPVRVMNMRNNAVAQKAGCLVADLQQVEEVGPADGRHGDGIATPLRHRGTSPAAPDSDCAAHEGRANSVHMSGDVPEFVHDLIDKVQESVPNDVRRDLKNLLVEYADVFSQSEYELGLTDSLTSDRYR